MSIEPLVRDIRQGVRRLARDWRFTAGAVLILGLGIGANTAIFSVVNAALFRDSLVASPERLVDIYQNGEDGLPTASSYPAFEDMAAYADLFTGVTAISLPGPVRYLHQDAVRTAVAEYASASYSPVLGLSTSLGRWFTAAEDRAGAERVAVMGHQIWTRQFAADPAVVGRTIRIDGDAVTIIGVAPEGHHGTMNIGLVTDFWLPVTSLSAAARERSPQGALLVKARLRDGVTVAQAQAAMDVLGARLAREYPGEDPGRGIAVRATTGVRVHPRADIFLAVFAALLLVVVGLVLAIACSNLATLLLMRGAARAKEVSVRLALGATRRQIVWHLLTESALLSLAGGAAGCVLAWWGIRALRAVELPVTFDFTLDYRVLGFAVAVSLLAATAFGLVPALKSTRIDLVPALRDEAGSGVTGRRRFTLKNALVVFQVAVSIVLLAAAGAFLRLMVDSRAQPTGFAVDGVALLETDASFAGYSADEANRISVELRRRVAAIPGVQATALAGGEPMQSTGTMIVVESAADSSPTLVSSFSAGPGYFETLNIPILVGRAIDERDGPAATRVAVVSETMARRHFGGIDAIGRRFRQENDQAWIEIVGVVRDTATADRAEAIIDPEPEQIYLASSQWDQPLDIVIARSSLDAASLVAALQRELRAIDPGLPVIQAKTMERHLEDSLFLISLIATFLGLLGALGLVLAGTGLYAVVAFAVARRSREIGIRMALGAQRQQVAGAVVREMAGLVGAGTGVGLLLALLAILGMRQLSLSVPGAVFVPEPDPIVLLVIAAFMTIVGAMAAYVPARRAARMNPLVALRRD